MFYYNYIAHGSVLHPTLLLVTGFTTVSLNNYFSVQMTLILLSGH